MKKYIILVSIIFLFLSACSKGDNIYTKEIVEENNIIENNLEDNIIEKEFNEADFNNDLNSVFEKVFD